jgi:hypothetical protein
MRLKIKEAFMPSSDIALFVCDQLNINPKNLDTRVYEFGTITGICKVIDEKLYIIAIENTDPHNGQFEPFVECLESRGACVIEFMNERLKQYFIKRGWVEFNRIIDFRNCAVNGVEFIK